MKRKSVNKLSILAAILLLVSSGLAAQIVSGNGNVVVEKRDVGNFTGVTVRSGIDLIIKQGSQEALEIKADENLQEFIISEVTNNVLHIYIKKNTNIRNIQAMDAFVTVNKINKLTVSGGGDAQGQSMIITDDIDIGMSGGGDLVMELTAERVSCNVGGGGDVELNGKIKELKSNLSGGGDLELDAGLEVLELNLSGGGDAEISGGDDASLVSIAVSGGGDLELDIACDEIKNSMSGGGDAQISAGNRVNKASFSSTGGGDLSLEIQVETLEISVGGGGDASLRGSTGNLACEIKSGGNLSAEGFRARNARLKLTGGADARINVEETLAVDASGGGQVYVSGDPEIDARLSGGSKVHKQ